MDLVEFLQKEKENCTLEFIHYGTVGFRVLPVAASIILGVYLLTDSLERYEIILFVPFIILFLLIVLMTFSILTYAADLPRRIYEKAINKYFGLDVAFRYKDIQNVFYDHSKKTNFSIEMNVFEIISNGLILTFYSISAFRSIEVIQEYSALTYSTYLIALVLLPIAVFTSFVRIVKKLKKTAFTKEKDLLGSISVEDK